MPAIESHLLSPEFLANMKPFKPCATYFKPMDHMLYLNEDVSYRAKWIDRNFDVLLHPYEDKVVGVQIHGFSQIVARDLHRILGPVAIAGALVQSLRLAANKFAWRTAHRLGFQF